MLKARRVMAAADVYRDGVPFAESCFPQKARLCVWQRTIGGDGGDTILPQSIDRGWNVW